MKDINKSYLLENLKNKNLVIANNSIYSKADKQSEEVKRNIQLEKSVPKISNKNNFKDHLAKNQKTSKFKMMSNYCFEIEQEKRYLLEKKMNEVKEDVFIQLNSDINLDSKPNIKSNLNNSNSKLIKKANSSKNCIFDITKNTKMIIRKMKLDEDKLLLESKNRENEIENTDFPIINDMNFNITSNTFNETQTSKMFKSRKFGQTNIHNVHTVKNSIHGPLNINNFPERFDIFKNYSISKNKSDLDPWKLEIQKNVQKNFISKNSMISNDMEEEFLNNTNTARIDTFGSNNTFSKGFNKTSASFRTHDPYLFKSNKRMFSEKKVNDIFNSYFYNIDTESDEMRELREIVTQMKLRHNNYKLNGKTFNFISEKFKPNLKNIENFNKMAKSKQLIIKAIPKTLFPSKIPYDYLERRKFINSMNLKLSKNFQTLIAKEKNLTKIKDVCDLIVKFTDDSLERVFLCYFYIGTTYKYDSYYDYADYNRIYSKYLEKIKISEKKNLKLKDQNKENVSNDINQHLNQLISLEHIFKNQRTFFYGYTTLFIEMLRLCGFDTERNITRVNGFYKQLMSFDLKKSFKIDYSTCIPNHEWINIKLFDNNYLIDPSLAIGQFDDDGVYKEEFTFYYFLTPPHFLIETHFAINESNQLLNKRIKPTEFINLHKIDYKGFYDAVFKYDFTPIQPYLPYIFIKPRLVANIQFELPYSIVLQLLNIEHISIQADKFITFVRSGNSYVLTVTGLEIIGVYTLIIRSSGEDKKNVNPVSVNQELVRINLIVSNED